MAAHFQEEEHVPKECGNCGARDEDNMALCSRCHSIHFCSRKCQKAYWPFHREWCHKNDFADHVEKSQPKFARFLRKHGKQAVLKDDEVDRLERKVASMEDLYGRANPKPKPPTYDAEDMLRMKAAEEADALRLRERDAAAVSASLRWRGRAGAGSDLAGATHSCVAAASTKVWDEIAVPQDLGADHGTYKWRQNQTFVEVFVLLPPRCRGARDVEVELSCDALEVRVCDQEVLAGELFAPIKAEASTWIISDGVLEISLLKRNRRGNYENGSSNADTFWFGVLRGAAGKAAAGRAPPAAAAAKMLPLEYPPQAYYDCEWVREPEGGGPAYDKGRGGSSRGKSNAGASSGRK